MNNTLFIFILFSLFLSIGCENNAEITTPKSANIVESVYASGIVKSENQYEVFTESNGLVENIFVREGELIKKGTPIFQIKNINSKLSAKNSRLFSMANDYSLNKEKLLEAKESIEFAQKKLTNDSLLFVRHQTLWRQNIGSKVELEQKQLNLENAKVNLKKTQTTYEDIDRQLKLISSQSKNSLKIAEAAENNLIIRSDLDGYVYRINVKQGEMATSMSPIAVIGKENYIIELNVDEFDIVKIRKGQKVIIRMDSYPNQVYEAKVSFVYPMMNERTRTFKVEAIFSKEPKVLYPNLTLEANIIINERKNVLTIPSGYLLNDSSVILEDGTLKELKIGLKDYNLTEIVSGIDKDTKIRMPKNEK